MTGWLDAGVGAVAQNPEWALLLTFACALIEATALLGAIMPGTGVLMAVAGAAAVAGMSMLPFLAVAIAGAILGDGLSFWVGRRFGPALRARWPLRDRPGLLHRAEQFFTKYGAPSVAIARFLPVLRSTLPLAAGMARMPVRQFLPANVASAVLWGLVHVYPAQLAGVALARLRSGDWGAAGMLALGIAVVMALAFLAHRLLRRGFG